ncbi:MAG: hypothetical protein IT374_19645 [Polyangiaceae bacterium]|nr:hypothetical protein [Polyangiaceae bacterium]
MGPERLPVFAKLPLGGLDRRAILAAITTHGASVAEADLAAARALATPTGIALPEGSVVVLLGGSAGILRALAIQLLFGERVPVVAVHYDSEKLQIGAHQARALVKAAADAGVECAYTNADATRPETIASVVESLRGRYRVAHLVNGIAAGATKRFASAGPGRVREIDVAFDPVRQVVDYTRPENLRGLGVVDVDVASPADIERTYKFMGHSTGPWADTLAQAGLLAPRESVVAFTDYDFELDDPVYAMGPLHQAKVIQRASMEAVGARYGVRTVRVAYPAMNTSALGAIPGGTLMFTGTAELLLERGEFRTISELGRDTMPMFSAGFDAPTLSLDAAYQAVLREFHGTKRALRTSAVHQAFPRVFSDPRVMR